MKSDLPRARKLITLSTEPTTFGERISDRLAKFGGSWTFIIFFAVVIVIWILFNVLLLLKPFDPYPFILLNLILSCLAALQAPVIMMSQNRQEAKDRIRAENDFEINVMAEREIRLLREILEQIQHAHLKRIEELCEAHAKILSRFIAENAVKEQHDE
jgi:uncharacterized membrane protein